MIIDKIINWKEKNWWIDLPILMITIGLIASPIKWMMSIGVIFVIIIVGFGMYKRFKDKNNVEIE